MAIFNLNLNVQNKILKYWEELDNFIVTSRYFPAGVDRAGPLVVTARPGREIRSGVNITEPVLLFY